MMYIVYDDNINTIYYKAVVEHINYRMLCFMFLTLRLGI